MDEKAKEIILHQACLQNLATLKISKEIEKKYWLVRIVIVLLAIVKSCRSENC